MPLEAANGTRRIKFLEKIEEISLTQAHEPTAFLLATWKAGSKAGSLPFLQSRGSQPVGSQPLEGQMTLS